MTRVPEPDALRARLLAVIERGAAATLPDPEFNELARVVFAHQYARNGPYRAYCDARGVSPETVADWRDVPAVPTDAFRATPLLCGDPADAVAVFRTSGTTAGPQRRGQHFFRDLSLYEAALLAGFERHLLPDGERIRILSLVPPPREQPDSSLSHMIGAVMARLGTEGSDWFVTTSAGLRLDAFLEALNAAVQAGAAVAITGTTLAFVHLMDALGARGAEFALPPGSRIMDTGGSKGAGGVIDRPEMLRLFRTRLGVPTGWVVNEYGMTEMSSQFYDGVAGDAPEPTRRRHRGPGWVRSEAVDPETLQALPAGEVGVLRHVDLANLDSVAALQTADLGRVSDDGLELIGRARGAETRGCSIAMDALLEALGRA